MKHIGIGLAALSLSVTLLGSIAPIAEAQSGKHHMKVMYKAHCGKMYTAAQAKKYHYKCPMDHKPLMKMSGHMSDSKHDKMGGMKM